MVDVVRYRLKSSFQIFFAGCGKFGKWKESDNSATKYMWNGTQCYQHEERNCISPRFQCGTGPYQRYVSANETLCSLYEKRKEMEIHKSTPTFSCEIER